MGKREQRAGVLPTNITRVTGTVDPALPGNRDVVQQPGYEMEDNQCAGRAGEAVAGKWGGSPNPGSPQVGRKQP